MHAFAMHIDQLFFIVIAGSQKDRYRGTAGTKEGSSPIERFRSSCQIQGILFIFLGKTSLWKAQLGIINIPKYINVKIISKRPRLLDIYYKNIVRKVKNG